MFTVFDLKLIIAQICKSLHNNAGDSDSVETLEELLTYTRITESKKVHANGSIHLYSTFVLLKIQFLSHVGSLFLKEMALLSAIPSPD